MKNLKPTLLLLFLLLLYNSVLGQSTSNWIKVKSDSDSKYNYPIKKNSCYITIQIAGERIYHDSNWWTNLVSKNRQAFVTINVKADYENNKSLEDTRSSKMVKIQKKQKPVDLGWSQYIVREIPSTFSSIKLDLALNSTSEDGADEVISIASDLSSTIPALSVAQSYMGIISGAKLILDKVFQKSLAETHLNSSNEILSASKNNIATGYYVIFGKDDSTQYQTYITDSGKLYWDGAQLKYNNAPITNLTYFIVLIDAKEEVFPEKNINMLSNIGTAWAQFYTLANQKIGSMTIEEIEQTKKSSRELLTSAKLVLDKDPNYIQSEKEVIHRELKSILSANFTKRVNELNSGTIFTPISLGID